MVRLTPALVALLPAVLLTTGTVTAQPRTAVLDGSGVAMEPVAGDEPSWVELMQQAELASRTTAYRATMQVVQLDVDGPYVTEVDVAQDDRGRSQLGVPERWLVGRDEGSGYFRDHESDWSTRLPVAPQLMAVDRVREAYLVEVVGRASLRHGPALAVTFTRRDAMTPSERVFVDDASHLVVRRETYDLGGHPVRVVSLRDLVVDGEVEVEDAPAQAAVGRQVALSPRGVELLDDAGWIAPARLALGFGLVRATALDEEEGAVQLEYSDGLYQLSIYEQVGSLSAAAIEGAVAITIDGRRLHRWPGSEPERVVWSGDGRTFTAVTDLPHEQLLETLAPLPADPPSDAGARVRRGLRRLGSWFWPFDDQGG